MIAAAQLVDGCEARLGRITSVRDAAEVVFDGQHAAGEPVASTRTDKCLAHAPASVSRAVDGLVLPQSQRLGPIATIDGGNLRFEIGDDMRREGANVQKDHYHIHDMFQSSWIGAGAG